MIHIAVCDDNAIERQLLKNIVISLMREKGIECDIISFENGTSLIEDYKTQQFELIFLDIMMEDLDGIEVGKLIREKDLDTEIIYCTSSQDFLLESYEVFAMGYLLKPYDIMQISRLLDFYCYKHEISATKYILVKSNFIERKIFYKEIVYVESMDKVVIFHTNTSGAIKVYDKLSHVQEELKDNKFLRCHQSYIINMDFIVRISENEFITITNHSIPIRRRDRKQIRDTYFEYKSEQGNVTSV